MSWVAGHPHSTGSEIVQPYRLNIEPQISARAARPPQVMQAGPSLVTSMCFCKVRLVVRCDENRQGRRHRTVEAFTLRCFAFAAMV